LYLREQSEYQRLRTATSDAATTSKKKKSASAVSSSSSSSSSSLSSAEQLYLAQITPLYTSSPTSTAVVAAAPIEGWKKTLVQKLTAQLTLFSRALQPLSMPAALSRLVHDVLFRYVPPFIHTHIYHWVWVWFC